MQPFHFRVGEFECAVVSDGTHAFPARNFFVNAPEEELQASLAAHGIQDGRVVAPFHCLVLRAANRNVLVDTGVGAGLSPESGKLIESLAEMGLAPAQIDVVLLSHGHADHTGGAANADGPAFPNARYVVGRQDFKFWMSEGSSIAGVRAAAARKKLGALAGRLELIEAGDEPVPGIRAIAAPGHTPGNFAYEISSGREMLLYVADAVAHPIHFDHPDWNLEADLDPAMAIETRRRLLERALAAGASVAAYHMPYPAVGRITKFGDRLRFH